MSDKPESKKEGSGKDPDFITKKQAVLVDLLAGFIGPIAATALIETLIWLLKRRMTKSATAPEHLISYGEALVALRAKDASAARTIIQFVGVGLSDANRERQHFQ